MNPTIKCVVLLFSRLKLLSGHISTEQANTTYENHHAFDIAITEGDSEAAIALRYSEK
jgi:hypothetical protein